MKCPFQWTEKDIVKAYSPPIRTRRFIECEEYACSAYIGGETVKIGEIEYYNPGTCGMFPNNKDERMKHEARK